MIAYIKGTIIHIDTNFIEVLTADIGYKLRLPAEELSECVSGAVRDFFVYTHVKEDAIELYGFNSRTKRALFENLISVSGIGPKSALGVLSVASVTEIESAIIRGDSKILEKVSGIGKKTAERIVLELKNKYKGRAATHEQTTGSSIDVDVIDALISLGYTADQARQAIRTIDQDIMELDAKIKACLTILGK